MEGVQRAGAPALKLQRLPARLPPFACARRADAGVRSRTQAMEAKGVHLARRSSGGGAGLLILPRALGAECPGTDGVGIGVLCARARQSRSVRANASGVPGGRRRA